MSFNFLILTFGCKVNQYESQAQRERWQALGGVECADPTQAQVILLATCAVTAEAVGEVRRKAARLSQENPQARIFITGCAATASPKDFPKRPKQWLVSQQKRPALLFCHPLEFPECSETEQSTSITELPEHTMWDEASFAPFSISTFKRARPVVKIQDGCSQGCTYCIVPLSRGPSRSRAPDQVLAETKRLLASGHREIMLSGINLRQYSHEGKNFWAVLRLLQTELAPEWQGKARFRLSSLEPGQLNTEALESLEQSTMFCPHLHLSLQSGSPSVLRRMGRDPRSVEALTNFLASLAGFWPKYSLGADILMGFPEESPAEVNETLNLVQSLPLSYAHVFPWSSRPGTKAALMPALPKKQRQKHAAIIRELTQEKAQVFLEELVKESQLTIALEGGRQQGLCQYYVECEVLDIPEGVNRRELLSASPVGIAKDGKLLVRCL